MLWGEEFSLTLLRTKPVSLVCAAYRQVALLLTISLLHTESLLKYFFIMITVMMMTMTMVERSVRLKIMYQEGRVIELCWELLLISHHSFPFLISSGT
jgi:hypothetical protein